MRIVAESQPVLKSSYVHLAYVSAEPAATFLLSVGILLGITILIKAALSTWRSRSERLRNQERAGTSHNERR